MKLTERLIKFISSHRNTLLLYALAVAAYMLMFGCFVNEAAPTGSKLIMDLIKFAGDAALIFLPYWLLNSRWRRLVIVPLWIFAIWAVINLTYFRFWGDIIPPAVLMSTGNVNRELIEAGVSLLRWRDMVYLLCPVIVTVCAFRLPLGKDSRFIVKTKIILTLISIVVSIIGQLAYHHSQRGWDWRLKEVPFLDSVILHYTVEGAEYATASNISASGWPWIVVSYVRVLAITKDLRIELTEKQNERIESCISRYNGEKAIMSENRGRNVVYIIVESLNAEVVGMKVNGYEVTPTLDSLLKKDGTVYFPNVVPQVKYSGSTDGHLLLLTGLLPLKTTSFAMTVGPDNEFPSVMKGLPEYHHTVILADKGNTWREKEIFMSFGFEEAYNKQEFDSDLQGLGSDEAMFAFAARKVKTLKEPFFLGMMTISMHVPFQDKNVDMPEQIADAVEYETRQKDYLSMTSSFDRALGQFLKSVPPETIVIIASDHTQTEATFGDSEPTALFLAINTGHTERIDRLVGQANLFALTLDLLGIDNVNGYRGVVPSALQSTANGTKNSYGKKYGQVTPEEEQALDEAFDVSDLIIRGDYFASDGK